jgi:hypothetical protein
MPDIEPITNMNLQGLSDFHERGAESRTTEMAMLKIACHFVLEKRPRLKGLPAHRKGRYTDV